MQKKRSLKCAKLLKAHLTHFITKGKKDTMYGLIIILIINCEWDLSGGAGIKETTTQKHVHNNNVSTLRTSES